MSDAGRPVRRASTAIADPVGGSPMRTPATVVTICVATVLLETGRVPMQEPETTLRLEAPAGVVEIRAACRDGRVESVELTNVPAFAAHLGAPLEVRGLGSIAVDVAFGGMWYAIADADGLGFAIERHEAGELSRVGELIRVAAREQLSCVHPENTEIAGVSIVQIAEPWQGVGAVTKNAGRLELRDRYGVVRAHGRAARARTDEGRRRDDARVRDRLDVRRPHRRGDDRRRRARDRAGDPRQRVHHRDHRALRRPGRSVP
jgi:proline racemase